MRHLFKAYAVVWICVLSVLGIVGLAIAQVPFNGPFGPQEQPFALAASPTITGDITASSGGLLAKAACSTDAVGNMICVSNDGMQAGFPATDAAPDNLLITGFNAPPLGSTNKAGGQVHIAGGDTTRSSTAVQANCGASDTWTMVTASYNTAASTVTSTTKTCTRDASVNDATRFTCGTTDAELATNAMTCLATATGVAGCAGTSCTVAANGFAGVAGNFYLYRAASEPAAFIVSLASSGNHGVVTTAGNQGNVVFWSTGAIKGGITANGTVIPTDTLLGFTSDSGLANIANGLVYDGSKGLKVGTSNSSGVVGTLALARYTATRTINKTLVAEDCFGIEASLTDNFIWTLPTTPPTGCAFTFINTAAAGAALVTITSVTPNAIAGTTGAITSNGTAANVWNNTKATSLKNDFVDMVFDGTNWQLTDGRGVWAN